MSTSPKHLFIARFNNSKDCMNRMCLLLDGNIGTYAERFPRVRGICVGRPTDMNFPAVANRAILKFRNLISGDFKMDKNQERARLVFKCIKLLSLTVSHLFCQTVQYGYNRLSERNSLLGMTEQDFQ
jgi:hypothetical protein